MSVAPLATPPSVVSPPRSRQELLAAWRSVDAAGTAFWDSIPERDFWRPLGEAWSPAENLVHLHRSTAPVAMALGLPRVAVLARFGWSRRPSRSYERLVADYHAALAGGLQAGRFAPSATERSATGALDSSTERRRLMERREKVARRLEDHLRRWGETALDRLRLPHPGLGRLTVREMMLFTLYHNVHHAHGVATRLAAGA